MCYDQNLEGNPDAILNAACGQHEGTWQDACRKSEPKARVPHVAPKARLEAETLLSKFEIEGRANLQSGHYLTYHRNHEKGGLAEKNIQVDLHGMQKILR